MLQLLLQAALAAGAVATIATTPAAGMPPGHPQVLPGTYNHHSASTHETNSPGHNAAQGPDHSALSHTAVASVNGRDILMPELMKMMKHMASSEYRGKLAPEQAGELKKRALDRLIFQELLFQSALSQGVNVKDQEVEATVARMERNAGGRKHYEEYLATRGLTPEQVREEVERYLYIQKTIEAYTGNRADVTEAELKEAYREHIDQFTQIEKAEVEDVVFFLDPAQPDSLEKARAVLEKIKGPCGCDLSKLTPDGSFAIRKVKMDGTDEPDLYRQIKSLEDGEVSPVIIADNTIHIVKMVRFTPYSVKPLKEVSRILRAEISNRKRKKIMAELETRLRSEADIKIYDMKVE